MLEIERKFLVASNHFISEATSSYAIAQGYLSVHPERTVRVRLLGEKGFITVKGKSNDSGTTRIEWEKEIAAEEATLLLSLCDDGKIVKKRYLVKKSDVTFEVDVFYGDNEGLVIAEIELENEDQVFEKPKWLGKEVTGDTKYYNSYLSSHPFKTW
jgi:adenylate cyclase